MTDGLYLFLGKWNSLTQVGNMGEHPDTSRQRLKASDVVRRCRNHHHKTRHRFINKVVNTDPCSFSNDLFWSRQCSQEFWSSAASFKHLYSLFSSLCNDSLMFYRQAALKNTQLKERAEAVTQVQEKKSESTFRHSLFWILFKASYSHFLKIHGLHFQGVWIWKILWIDC